jgi:hypothetical protein
LVSELRTLLRHDKSCLESITRDVKKGFWLRQKHSDQALNTILVRWCADDTIQKFIEELVTLATWEHWDSWIVSGEQRGIRLNQWLKEVDSYNACVPPRINPAPRLSPFCVGEEKAEDMWGKLYI